MRRALAIPLGIGSLLLVTAVAFLVPTLWGRPLSIDHFYTRVFLELLLDHPMLLSQLRVLEPYGLHFHNDDLDDFSVEFQLEESGRVRRNLELLASYPREEQSAEQQLSSDVLAWSLTIQAEGERYQFHDYPLNQLSGIHTRLPDFMLNVHSMNDARDARNYVARLSRFGVALDQVIASVRHRAERGLAPPRFVFARVREDVELLLASPASESVLVSGFAEKLAALEGLSAQQRRELVEAARAAVDETVLPAYRRLAGALAPLEAAAGHEAGAWKHPDGDGYYAWALRLHTTSDLDADAIHAIGLAEVDRIHGEMRAILAEEGYDASDLGATLRAVHSEERFLYPDSDEGRAQILADYRAIVAAVEPRLPGLFGRLPRARVEVERVPEFKEAGAAGAYYQPPPLDGSRPGTFFANLRSVREVAKFGMRTLAYHEAIPGHHLQIALGNELEDVPLFRRVVPFTAYIEGWALYAERLAAEQGLHPTPYDHLGQLVAEVFRAVRLVVDTGLHAKRWTREQAIDYMLANTGMPETDVVAEVERYIVLPGQACAYKIGQLEILRLRERAEDALGPRFDLASFHDVVLSEGALPLVLLERQVEAWIEASAPSPL
jgi:uncharacterized protein (DUF885 family)